MKNVNLEHLIKKILSKEEENISNSFEEIFRNKTIENKLEIFNTTKQILDDSYKRKNKFKILYDLARKIINESIINKESESTENTMLELQEYVENGTLITLIKKNLKDGNIEYAQLFFKALIKRSSLSTSMVEDQDFQTILNYNKSIFDYQKTLYFHIDNGLHKHSILIYIKIYTIYFKNFSLHDAESKIWEELWSKVQSIKEEDVNWEIIKLDLTLITDIIIKHKTGLSVPFFRKKKEITRALILGNDYEFLRKTVVKYFFEAGKNELCKQILTTYKTDHKWKKDKDYEFQFIEKNLELDQPKEIPSNNFDQLELDESPTVLITAKKNEENEESVANINVKINEALSAEESNFNETENNLESKSWRELVNHYSLSKNYEKAKELILKNIEELDSEEKINYQLYLLELLVSLGEFNEVLNRLDIFWKDIQDLENFKILKYIEGESLWGLNRKKEAIDCYRKVIDIDPTYKLAKWRIVEFSL